MLPQEPVLAPGTAGLVRPAELRVRCGGLVTRPTDCRSRARLTLAGGLDGTPRQPSQATGASSGWTAADPLRSAAEPGWGSPRDWTGATERRARSAAPTQAGRPRQILGRIDAGGVKGGDRRRVRPASDVPLEADPGNGPHSGTGSGHVVRPATHVLTQDS